MDGSGVSPPARPARDPLQGGRDSAPEPSERLLNRELSWLDFNERVLALARDPGRPVLERAKFLAIFSSNMDEFFQVRVSGLQEQVASGVRDRAPDGADPVNQLAAVRRRAQELAQLQAEVFGEEVAPALKVAGICYSPWTDLDEDDRKHLVEVFEERVFPVLTPLAVDPAHPFPYISNLSMNLAVVVRDPLTGEQGFARVKVPPLLARFLVLPDGERVVPIEQVIAAQLDELFPGMEILAHHPFRVTRDADFELTDEAEDLLEAVESVLTLRRHSEHVVRLEVDTTMRPEVLALLTRELEFPEQDVTVIDGPLDLSGLMTLYSLERPDLKDPTWTPQTQSALSRGDATTPVDFFRVLRAGDVLVHHPYDSFATSVEAFVDQASRDPRVLAIKQTLYRTAGPESLIVRSLRRAADAGKQVVALVELKARFDEQANVERARELEEAGVHVVYGLVGLKTHSKILLVVRQEDDGIRRYCHIGTGNYNPITAALYEDLGLFTSDPDLGADVTELFNYLTGYSHQMGFRKLLVAPSTLRSGIVERIRRQAHLGLDGRIVMKMNSLVDPETIEELYAASGAGTPIDLIVRGVCCLRPGVPGLSDTIRVRSLVGRYLEHSRICCFGTGENAEYLIGSADLMPRNLDRRVEALAPVTAPALQERLEMILDTNLADNTLAWELHGDGTWHRILPLGGAPAVNTHDALQRVALARTRGERESRDVREVHPVDITP